MLASSLAYAKYFHIVTEEEHPYKQTDNLECKFDAPQMKYEFSSPILLPRFDEEALKIAVGKSLKICEIILKFFKNYL
jgi:hypothetical protein